MKLSTASDRCLGILAQRGDPLVVFTSFLSDLEISMIRALNTTQHLELESKEGKAFLRKVLKHNTECSYREDWRLFANESQDWFVTFRRDVEGETGEPDVEVIVKTDVKVTNYQTLDEKDVPVPSPVGMSLDGSSTKAFCKLYMAGFTRISTSACAGSENSRAHKLAFGRVKMSDPQGGMEVWLSEQTVFVDGRSVICSGLRYGGAW